MNRYDLRPGTGSDGWAPGAGTAGDVDGEVTDRVQTVMVPIEYPFRQNCKREDLTLVSMTG